LAPSNALHLTLEATSSGSRTVSAAADGPEWRHRLDGILADG